MLPTVWQQFLHDISLEKEMHKFADFTLFGHWNLIFCWIVTYFQGIILDIQLLAQWNGLMLIIHFFFFIEVKVQENQRYMFAVLYFDLFPFFLTYVLQRVSSIQLQQVATWFTLQPHSSMHLTTTQLMSTDILESLLSILFSGHGHSVSKTRIVPLI